MSDPNPSPQLLSIVRAALAGRLVEVIRLALNRASIDEVTEALRETGSDELRETLSALYESGALEAAGLRPSRLSGSPDVDVEYSALQLLAIVDGAIRGDVAFTLTRVIARFGEIELTSVARQLPADALEKLNIAVTAELAVREVEAGPSDDASHRQS